MELTEENAQLMSKGKENLSDFIRYIFPLSFRNYVEPSHLYDWANRIQNNKKTATLSARKHLKSTLMYAYIMWRILRFEFNEDWLYMSYTDTLSRYHVANIKKLIRNNPVFDGLKDLSGAESTIRYTWDKAIFSVSPGSILRFNRGWHGYGVICDDILADPTNELNMTIIQTITTTFFEEVLSLPIEGGELHLVGTAQHSEDLFFQIKNKAKSFNWEMYTAIVDDLNKITLWPEMFGYDRLIEIRDQEIGIKAFSKEYLCSPVWSEDAYFKKDEIMSLVDAGLNQLHRWDSKDEVVIAGFDIGKVRHPSHFTVFLHSKGLIIQIFHVFMDNWDYTKQVEFINQKIDDFNIRRVFFDATRGELDSFMEQGVIRRGLWVPVKFTQQEKFKMAANFAKTVNKGVIRFQNSQRMIRSILSVNNNLEALETTDGHGDAFWSIAMALSYRESGPIPIVGAGHWK